MTIVTTTELGFVVKSGSENSIPLPQCEIRQDNTLDKRHQSPKDPGTENKPIEFFIEFY